MIAIVLGIIIFGLVIYISQLKSELDETKLIERGLWVFFIKGQFIRLPFPDPVIDDAQRKYIDFHRDEIDAFDKIMKKYKGTPHEIRYPFMKNAKKVAEKMLKNAKEKQEHSKKRFPSHDRR